MGDAKKEFNAIEELGKLLVEGDFNVTLFGVPVAGPNARALREEVEARISAAVAEEREQIAKYVFTTMEHGQVSLDDVVAAIRARGTQKGEPS